MKHETKLLDTNQTAELLGIKAGTLNMWRCNRSDGPPYIKVGRLIRYDVNSIYEWLNNKTTKETIYN